MDIQGVRTTTRGFNCPNPHVVLTLPVLHNTIEYCDTVSRYLLWHQSVGIAQHYTRPMQIIDKWMTTLSLNKTWMVNCCNSCNTQLVQTLCSEWQQTAVSERTTGRPLLLYSSLLLSSHRLLQPAPQISNNDNNTVVLTLLEMMSQCVGFNIPLDTL